MTFDLRQALLLPVPLALPLVRSGRVPPPASWLRWSSPTPRTPEAGTTSIWSCWSIAPERCPRAPTAAWSSCLDLLGLDIALRKTTAMSKQISLPLAELPESKGPKRTPEQLWLAWAASEWADFHGAPMTVRWARDIALTRPLLRLHGEVELKRRWQAYLSTWDEYFAKRGWNIPTFSVSIDRYVGRADRVPYTRRRQLAEEEASCRDPLTGVDLRLNRRRG